MNKYLLLIFTLLFALGLSACQGVVSSPRATVEAIPTVVGDAALMVEGKLVPDRFVNLNFNMGGVVQELLVEEGQAVEAGDALARLDQHERLASAVSSAELEVVTARQALDQLNEKSDVSTAAALQKVADARDAVRSAERYLNNLHAGSRETDIDSARADVVLLKDQLEKAQKDFASYERKDEDNITRAAYLSKLADAQQKYDDAVRLLNNLQGTPSDIDLAIAEADLLLAQAQLALAESDYEEVKDGPDPDDLEAAQARLKAAENAMTAAQAALDDAELVAPFAGTIARLDLKQGEQVVPGAPALVLADFSRWRVETDDLNEMEIPRVQDGQAVMVIPDALPELELPGQVESISQIYEEKFSEVTYTARIDLGESDPRLRWGMTVSVRFDED